MTTTTPSYIAALREHPRLADHFRGPAKRWLVTGGAGFVGSHLAEALLHLGQQVVVLDNLSTGKRANLDFLGALASQLKQANPRHSALLRVIEGDIREPAHCQRACDEAEHVLHQAALGSVPRSIDDPLNTHASNVTGFAHMLEAARAAGCKSFVYASSSSVYGDHPELPKVEDRVGTPLSPYAASKATNEQYARAWRKAYGLATVGLRYFNVVGPRQDPSGPYAAVIPRWVDCFARGQRPQINGDGETSRDFCPVENVVQANLLASLAQTPADASGSDYRAINDVYNVALGGRTTLNELFAIIRAAMVELGQDCAQLEALYADFRAGDVRHSHANIDRAQTELGYAPTTPLQSAIKRTSEWLLRTQMADNAD